MANVTLKEFISAEAIAGKVKELGEKIAADYAGEKVFVVGVLKGSFIFMADLVRHMDCETELAFMQVSSYGSGTVSSGTVRMLYDIDRPIKDLNVLIVEDIIDTGITLSYLVDTLQVRKPKSLKICTLLDKPSRRLSNTKPDYVGFSIPDEFVVGYGLDYDGRFRALPYIGTVSFD